MQNKAKRETETLYQPKSANFNNFVSTTTTVFNRQFFQIYSWLGWVPRSELSANVSTRRTTGLMPCLSVDFAFSGASQCRFCYCLKTVWNY